jgi:transaldolase
VLGIFLQGLTKCRYHDTDPIFGLCVKAQAYYEHHAINTRVKACSVISVQECMQLAGVAAFTIAPPLLEELAVTREAAAKLGNTSLFNQSKIEARAMESFIEDEHKYREAFGKSDGGKGRLKTIQVQSSSPVLSKKCRANCEIVGDIALLRVPD